jgi:hypothetical protein
MEMERNITLNGTYIHTLLSHEVEVTLQDGARILVVPKYLKAVGT